MNNPVFQGLISGDQHLGFGTEKVRFFDDNVSPFAGFEEGYAEGFDDLYDLLPSGRNILYATPLSITHPKRWQLLREIKGLQFVYDTAYYTRPQVIDPLPLQQKHIEQMMQLAALTKPGPFGSRTIEFGHYFGIFENGRLVAMTGQRLHVKHYTEVSAVCTHPNHLGKGYASSLVQHQVNLILKQGQTPFLHVREDNLKAIGLYQRIGFKIRGPMNFYFMKKSSTG